MSFITVCMIDSYLANKSTNFVNIEAYFEIMYDLDFYLFEIMKNKNDSVKYSP